MRVLINRQLRLVNETLQYIRINFFQHCFVLAREENLNYAWDHLEKLLSYFTDIWYCAGPGNYSF